jgi:hypothetical protein
MSERLLEKTISCRLVPREASQPMLFSLATHMSVKKVLLFTVEDCQRFRVNLYYAANHYFLDIVGGTLFRFQLICQ